MREDWVECDFNILIDNISTANYKIKQKDYISNGTIPVVDQGQELIGGYYNQKENILPVELPVIVFGDHTKCLKFINFNFIPGADGTKVLKINRLVLDKFIYYILKVLIFKIQDKGYARHFQFLQKEAFPLPPLPEQRAIVKKIEALFSSLDAAIADLKKAQQQLKIYRQAVLKKAFEGELTKEWRAKQKDLPTAEELLNQIQQEREKYYNKQIEDWKQAVLLLEKNEKVDKKPEKPTFNKIILDDSFHMESGFFAKLGSISNVVRGGSPRPAGDKRFYDGNIPFLKVADLTRINSKYVTEYSYTIKEAGLQKTRFLKKGTLVLSNSGATLGVARVLGIDATANDGIAAFLDLLPELVDFLYFYLNSKTQEFRAINQGAGQPNLNTDLLKDYSVPIFSIKEQLQIVKEIEARLSLCDAVEKQIQDSLTQAQALRQSILKKAFEGSLLSEEELNLCKQEPDYEPASVLLEKIKAEKEANKLVKKKTTKK